MHLPVKGFITLPSGHTLVGFADLTGLVGFSGSTDSFFGFLSIVFILMHLPVLGLIILPSGHTLIGLENLGDFGCST